MNKPQSSKKPKNPAKRKMLFQSPRGMHDILPLDQLWWEKLEKTAKDTAAFYNFRRIEPSIVESEELFKRALGETSDGVEKQLYVLKSEGGLVLRPEFTASMVRAYLHTACSTLANH